MSTIISRLFHSPESAINASAALRAEGYAAEDLRVLTHVGDSLSDRESFEREMSGMGVPSPDIPIYLEAIEQGAGFVVVRAPFGAARRAVEILDGFAPMQSSAVHADWYERARPQDADHAAPFSALLGLKLLISDPAPFSRLLGLPVLSRNQTSGTTLAPSRPTFPVRLVDDPAPLSRLLGLPLLLRHPAPFSALLGLPVLLGDDDS